MQGKIKIGVLWSVLSSKGQVSNAGNFLICERGKKLLEHFFSNNFNFEYIERTRPFENKYKGIIILGGPLITRKMHQQSRNIFNCIQNSKTPIFGLGLGISGKFIGSYENYFLDNESIFFWKNIYQTTKLLSVRDKTTYKVLSNYGIKAELTGCPALFDLDNSYNLTRSDLALKEKRKANKIIVTIPHLAIHPSVVRSFILTIYFLFLLNKRLKRKKFGVIFQHGCNNILTKIINKLACILGMKTYNMLGKSLDSSELRNYDICIGPRLHSHIFFLSLNKPSFLLNFDARTDAFLKTIKTPSHKYSLSGIKDTIILIEKKIKENNFDEFDEIPKEIFALYGTMKEFLNKIYLFYAEKN